MRRGETEKCAQLKFVRMRPKWCAHYSHVLNFMCTFLRCAHVLHVLLFCTQVKTKLGLGEERGLNFPSPRPTHINFNKMKNTECLYTNQSLQNCYSTLIHILSTLTHIRNCACVYE